MDLKQNKKDFEIKSRVETTRKLLFNTCRVIVNSENEIIVKAVFRTIIVNKKAGYKMRIQ